MCIRDSGMVANLFPLAPAGVGAVDAGMIGAFVLFGLPEETVFPAILVYRLIAFWLPIPPGIVAFFQLRARVGLWTEQGLPIDRGREPEAPAAPPAPFPGRSAGPARSRARPGRGAGRRRRSPAGS